MELSPISQPPSCDQWSRLPSVPSVRIPAAPNPPIILARFGVCNTPIYFRSFAYENYTVETAIESQPARDASLATHRIAFPIPQAAGPVSAEQRDDAGAASLNKWTFGTPALGDEHF
jgi:hypothetical protein